MPDITTAEIFALTPAQATARLAEMTAQHAAENHPAAPAAPANSNEARARLAELSKDSKWSESFLSGGVDARKEFDALVAKIDPSDTVDLAMANLLPAGHVDSGPGAPLRDMAASVPAFRELGLDDSTIQQVLSDRPVSAREHQMVKQLHDQRMSDPEWTAKLLQNQHDVRKEFVLMSVVLASTVDPSLK